MKDRGLYIIAFSGYLLFLVGLAAAVVFVDDETSRMIFMSILSTGLITFTMIFAILVTRGSTSERYRERYMQDEDEESK